MENITPQMKQAFLEVDEFIRLMSKKHRRVTHPEALITSLPFYKLDLTPLQQNILNRLLECDHLSIGEIAKAEATWQQVLTQPVRALVKMGLIRKFQKDDNLRFTYIALTDEGRALANEQREIQQNALMKALYSVATIDEMKHLKECLSFYCDIILRLTEKSY